MVIAYILRQQNEGRFTVLQVSFFFRRHLGMRCSQSFPLTLERSGNAPSACRDKDFDSHVRYFRIT